MAIHHQHNHEQTSNSSFFLDTLYCEEEKWEDNEIFEEQEQDEKKFAPFFSPTSSLLEQDLFWEDEELLSLFTKEHNNVGEKNLDSCSLISRQEAIEWMLKVNSYYGFSNLTSILAINYLDRFISSPCYQRDDDDNNNNHNKNKPWMIQLIAVTCLSLAAKVEETQVPLLLDLQVEDTKYVFEAKTIQRMELLVLSSLQWKMHPVTPLSFLDHIIRRLGLKTNLHWEFLRRCESLLITLVSDSRSTCYLPSVLATATMMHVIDQVEPFNSIDYQNQLLGILKINKEKVNDCYELICELLKCRSDHNNNNNYYYEKKCLKRKYDDEAIIPSSPSGVIDAIFSCDNSNDSWILSSSSSSPQQNLPIFKKNRAQLALI